MKMRQQMRTMACLVLLLLLLWVGVSMSTELDLQKRIIGGQPCDPAVRHYHVRLWAYDANGASDFCGGSLINERWILTAAHCLIPGRTIVAELGVHGQGPVQAVIITHTQIYSHGGQNHDIALLMLPETFQHGIQPMSICNRQIDLHDRVEIAGHAATTPAPYTLFGLLIRQPGFTPDLHCAHTTIVNCQLHINYPGDNIPEHVICGQSTGVDACLGDSGGGVVHEDSIYAIIIRVNTIFPCATPTIFVDICHADYLQWIRQTIGNRRVP